MRIEAHLPQRPERPIYRFRSIADDWSLNALKKIICDSAIWFSSPGKFNDPFECKPTFSFRGTPGELQRFSQAAAKILYSDVRYKHRAAKAQQIQRSLVENPAGYEKVLAEHFRSFGVLCLSEAIESILTWSHYADGHRGVALGFSIPKKEPLSVFSYARRVVYQKEYPTCRLVDIRDDKPYTAALLTKADGWSYEREWRVIVHKNDPGFRVGIKMAARRGELEPEAAKLLLSENGEGEYGFPPSILTEVVFGAQVDPAKKAQVMGWIARRAEPLIVRQAVQHRTAFGLSLEQEDYTHDPAALVRKSPNLAHATVNALARRDLAHPKA